MTTLPTASGRKVAAELSRLSRPQSWLLLLVLAMFVAESALGLVFPFAVGRMVDVVIEGSDGRTQWPWLAAGLLGAALAGGVLAWQANVRLAGVSQSVIAALREEFVVGALALDRDLLDSGDVVTRASDDVAEVSDGLPYVLPQLCSAAVAIVVVAAGMTAVHPWFLAAFAVVLPLQWLTLRWYLRTAPAVYAEDRRAHSERGRQVLGTLGNLPTVRAHRLEKRQLGLIRQTTWEVVRWSMRTRIVQNRLFGRLNVAEAVGLAAVLAVGVLLAGNGTASPGDVTAAALLFLQAVTPIGALLHVMDDVQQAFASLSRIVGVSAGAAAGAPEAPLIDGGHAPSTMVELDGVHFAYRPGHPVLHDVRLGIDRGAMVALVGASGSGKSTIASLVAGLHEPESGEVIRRIPRADLALVTQESHAFMGSLRENLLLACPDADDGRLVAALCAVGGQEFVEWPEGLDTLVGHGGRPLSVAQLQRLALARVWLADPAVVVLDEATSEAGTAEAESLDAAARQVTRGRTALVVAHRLSQVRGADRIAVLDRGRIAELGTHEELLEAGGSYHALWHAQPR
ncbi:MAG: ABC transporter ATP-binding protein [Tessaracoccus sp.]|uniref:ABC transporter ATP-binding protein n=1 Tax=Tessaracoccus sp. TaxID=1971211 RepID=UPI001EBD11DF|nr:ABC transporter ATP-binding protein [Tessaracoccus sp.]MBK7820293.1 ABC transporter ATP-binding protein [Tessaracoccus sp.]